MARSYDKQARARARAEKTPEKHVAPVSTVSGDLAGAPGAADLYRTLFVGTLVQESALTVGGGDAFGYVDELLCRDGDGRFTLRGSGLAGALVATARRLYADADLQRISLAPTTAAEDAVLPDSLWRVFTSHPDGSDIRPELRPGVGIRQDTSAARDGALFDSEVLPRGTKWSFYLEVKTGKAGGTTAEGIALAALREWEQGFCWVGANVARGLGWMRLTGLKIYRLKKLREHVDLWPNSRLPLPAALAKLGGVAPPFTAAKADGYGIVIPPLTAEWYYQDIAGQVQVGNRRDGYGLDGLSVGGHSTAVIGLPWDKEHLLWPDGAKPPGDADQFDPDAAIALTRSGDEHWEPLIPGSSLRGPLRHALSRHLRACGVPGVRDPLVQARRKAGEPADPVEDLFGSLDQGAALLVRDAYVDGAWRGAWLQQHAEDEFSSGAFGSAKFDRMALLTGCFRWRLMVQGATPADLDRRVRTIKIALNYGQKGFLGLGGQQWRGLGWCQWVVDRNVQRRAGDGGLT